MIKNLTGFKRRFILVVLDLFAIVIAYYASFCLRFDMDIPSRFIATLAATLPLIVAIRLAVFSLMGLYRGMWRYSSITDLVNILKASTIATIVISSVILFSHRANFPRSVLLIDYLLNIFFISGTRFAVRLSKVLFRPKSKDAKRILIVGTENTGERIGRELSWYRHNTYKLIGYIDDDPKKKNLRIHGAPILGTRNDICRLIEEKKIDEVVLATPSTEGSTINDWVRICKNSKNRKVKIKSVPSLLELLKGDVNINQIREVNPPELLNRGMVELDLDKISGFLQGKRVLITGAAGTIGSELYRQIVRFGPKELVLIDKNENALFSLEAEIAQSQNQVQCVSLIGDVKDYFKMERIFSKYRPQIVFHTAAFKHVSMCENNPIEAVLNNIVSTRMLTELADEHEVEKFVLISTDKAVSPSSVMGVTKKVAELIIQSMMGRGQTAFTFTRFGNVLGSSGSVLPIFNEQIKKGGPVTVTHPECSRFFMSCSEAVQLVIQAASIGKGGECFILKMGTDIKIVNLARNLITLSGFVPGKDIEIKFTGLRPGEKLTEQIMEADESRQALSQGDIFILKKHPIDKEILDADLDKLDQLTAMYDREAIIMKLQELVPSYRPASGRNKVSAPAANKAAKEEPVLQN
jgi:FlaA1/EpsC-like NDP-sugar epimerase